MGIGLSSKTVSVSRLPGNIALFSSDVLLV